MRFFFFLLGLVPLLIPIEIHADSRIINGSRVKSGSWPWMVAIIYAGKPTSEGQFCGGTLVHPSWVLTAGHCTHKRSTMKDYMPSDLEVFIGSENLVDTEKGETMGLEQIVRHPDYDGSDPALPPFADMALLKLKTPLHQSSILRVAETYYSSLTQVGQKATVMGWGSVSPSGKNYPNDLYQTEVPIISNTVCNMPRSYHGDIQSQMLCAGYIQGGTDACTGDSGGPLVVEDMNKVWHQIGIVSFGEGCALPNYYGVYTRVPSFQEFVSQTVCDTFPSTPQLQVHHVGTQVTASWNSIPDAQGYLFYYAQYSSPVNDITFKTIQSFDMGTQTHLSATLKSHDAYYIAVRAYQGNCYSPYSNLGTVIIP